MAAQKISDLDPLIREALAGWQLFRKLGFSADDIYVAVKEEGLFISIEWGGQSFSVRVGATKMNNSVLANVWSHAARVMKDATIEELQHEWDRSKAAMALPTIATNLELMKIYWPDHSKFKKEKPDDH